MVVINIIFLPFVIHPMVSLRLSAYFAGNTNQRSLTNVLSADLSACRSEVMVTGAGPPGASTHYLSIKGPTEALERETV